VTRARLLRDESGAAIVEAALVIPVLLLLTLGAIELSISIFLGASLESAVLQASRSGITGNTTGGVSREERIRDIIEENTYGFLDMDKVKIETLVYSDFADIGKPEPFEDANGNGSYDMGEVFSDINGNGMWDPDMGAAGMGDTGDIVLYRVTYDWGIITPLIQAVLGNSMRHVSSVAVRNEPF